MERYKEGLEALEEDTDLDPRGGEPHTPCLATPDFSRPAKGKERPPKHISPVLIKQEVEDLERVPQHLIHVARKLVHYHH